MPKLRLYKGEVHRDILVSAGANLYEVLIAQGVHLDTPCGGRCFCGKCRVKVVGAASPTPSEKKLLTDEDIKAGIRLACGITIEGDLTVWLPESERRGAVIQVEGVTVDYVVSPRVACRALKLTPPSITDQAGDVERLSRAYGIPLKMPLGMMAILPEQLRRWDWKAAVTALNDEVLEIAGQYRRVYGVAVDIGTTTMVAYLMDMETGVQCAVRSCLNPQDIHGADVIIRSDYARAGGLAEMAALVREKIDWMIGELVREWAIERRDIWQVTVVGNTIMMHLFAELTPQFIAVSPFIPDYTRGFDVNAGELDIRIHPLGKVSLLPCVAGYVGADTIAAILASGMEGKEELSLMVDIGTNGEIALGNREGILTCSAAAGPAFEGAQIRYGMGGVVGAIDTVKIYPDRVAVTTIGNDPAQGICGSGLVDAVSGMKLMGLIDEMGRILEDEEIEHPWLRLRVRKLDGKPAFLLMTREEGAQRDIYICQRDLREVQLAKGAIAAGIEVLLKERGVGYGEIAALYLAGGFGNHIDCDHACNIGLLPAPMRQKIKPIGNGAGSGAKMALLSAEVWKRAEAIRQNTGYIELSTCNDFQELFVDMMTL